MQHPQQSGSIVVRKVQQTYGQQAECRILNAVNQQLCKKCSKPMGSRLSAAPSTHFVNSGVQSGA